MHITKTEEHNINKHNQITKDGFIDIFVNNEFVEYDSLKLVENSFKNSINGTRYVACVEDYKDDINYEDANFRHSYLFKNILKQGEDFDIVTADGQEKTMLTSKGLRIFLGSVNKREALFLYEYYYYLHDLHKNGIDYEDWFVTKHIDKTIESICNPCEEGDIDDKVEQDIMDMIDAATPSEKETVAMLEEIEKAFGKSTGQMSIFDIEPVKEMPKEKSTPKKTVLQELLEAVNAEKEPMVRLSIDVPKSLHQKLAVFCAKTGKSKADIIRLLLKESLSSTED